MTYILCIKQITNENLLCSSGNPTQCSVEGNGKEIQKSGAICKCMASVVPQLVKNLPAIQETPVQFLGREDPLEKG